MRLILFAFALAIGLGYLLGGRLHNLGGIRFRHAWAGLAGVALQFLPVTGTLGNVALLGSFVLLSFVAVMNRRLPGFALVVVGLGLNFLVIAVNQGMPVSRQALVDSGQTATIQDLRTAGGSKHHLQTSEDDLTFLADRIGIPQPIGQAVSAGDVVAYGGVMWFVVAAMRHRDWGPTSDLRTVEALP